MLMHKFKRAHSLDLVKPMCTGMTHATAAEQKQCRATRVASGGGERDRSFCFSPTLPRSGRSSRMSLFLLLILPVLGGFALCSVCLLRNPHILHKKKRTAFYSTHISHRGGSGEKIESTMEAFTHAVENGTQMLEMDCHLTRDGHVVVSHDENLLRQTGLDADISSLDLQDLPLYKESLEVTFYEGRYSSGADRKFALLEDVFRKFPEMPVSIEIKENNRQLIEKVSDLVRSYNREKITVWASLKSGILKECRRTNDSMPYSFCQSRGVLVLLLFYTGLLPFVPLGESLLQFYLPRIINKTYIPEEGILRNKTIVSLLEKVTMRKSLFKHLAARGIQVHLFVCNKDEDIKAAIEVGATGVMTDYPTLLSSYLCTNPMPHAQQQCRPPQLSDERRLSEEKTLKTQQV